MQDRRWWHVAIFGSMALLSVLLIAYDYSLTDRIGGFAAILLLLGGWLLLGRRAWADPRVAIAFSVVLIVSCGVGIAFIPSLAIMQAIAYPLLWRLSASTHAAIVANIALALAVATGFLFALGTSESSLVQTLITTLLSLGFSLALGFWFTHVYGLVDERENLIRKLETAQSQVAALSRDAGAIDERERLARELHDTIAQDLTGLVMTAQRSRRELAAGNVAAAENQLAILEDNAGHALAETRTLVAASATVDVAGGLVPALARLGTRFERETGIAVSVETGNVRSLDRANEVVLLRCAQEALANVRKHSSASTVSVALTEVGDAVSLRVADDGGGFEQATAQSGFGLSGMRDRLALVSGTLQIASEPGKGTALVATLPGAVSA